MKRYLNIAFLFSVVINVFAGVPDGYYSSADNKKYTDLKSALCTIISNHKVLGYDNLWTYYPNTYYVLTDKSQVLDMYSDTKRYYSGTSAVSGLNKEHTVPKSWWGGSTSDAPGNDLFNVIPSDQTANSRKSNYSLGIVSSKSWTNGVTTVGTGTVNGHSASFFEPKDDYKGDFARIYFYMATCYPNKSWDSNNADAMTNSSVLTLQSWIIPMLLQWSASDPVDEAEIQRNEDIYKCQGNRNPFIDYPSLIDYIWGTKTAETFSFSAQDANTGEESEFVAGIPTFSVDYGTELEPKTVKDGTAVTVKGGTSTATLYTRVNGGDWVETLHTTGYNSSSASYYDVAAQKSITISGETCIEAYCTQEGYLNSDTLKVYYKGVDYDNDYLLYEAFDEVTAGNNTSNTGSASAWKGNTNFPTVSYAYSAGNAIKLGSGNYKGSVTSRALNSTGGTITVQIDVKGWTTVEGKLNVSVTGASAQTVSYTAKMADSFEHLQLTFTNVSANPTLTISTTAKRAFIDNVIVQQANPTITGDVNGDSVVNEADVTALVNVIYNNSTSTNADVNNDGKVDVADIATLIGILLK